MNVISKSDANALLAPVGLQLSEWGGVVAGDESIYSTAAFTPSNIALQLYTSSVVLGAWMGIGHSIVIQADNSTFPTSDECAVFRIIFGDLADDWLSAESRSLVFLNQEIGSVRIDVQRLALLIYYSILFEWHVHIVCIHENRVLRIGLEDGVVCVRARGRLDKSVEALVQGILDDPLRL